MADNILDKEVTKEIVSDYWKHKKEKIEQIYSKKER